MIKGTRAVLPNVNETSEFATHTHAHIFLSLSFSVLGGIPDEKWRRERPGDPCEPSIKNSPSTSPPPRHQEIFFLISREESKHVPSGTMELA